METGASLNYWQPLGRARIKAGGGRQQGINTPLYWPPLPWPGETRSRHRLARRRLGGEFRAAHAHAPARILPELLARMQVAERARHGVEVIRREPLRDIGVIERCLGDGLQDFLSQGRDLEIVTGEPCFIRLAVDVVRDLGAVGIGIRDAFIILVRDSFWD